MKGLPFNAEMALAVWEGRKSVVRRPMKEQPLDGYDHVHGYILESTSKERRYGDVIFGTDKDPLEGNTRYRRPPYYPGEVVYMQEPWGVEPGRYIQPSIPHGYGGRFEDEVFYKADDPNLPGMLWRSPVTMPQWASRLHLRLTVRPERLWEITEEDVLHEGFRMDSTAIFRLGYHGAFAYLWDSIYKKYPWSSNPWIWRYGMEEVWRRWNIK